MYTPWRFFGRLEGVHTTRSLGDQKKHGFLGPPKSDSETFQGPGVETATSRAFRFQGDVFFFAFFWGRGIRMVRFSRLGLVG